VAALWCSGLSGGLSSGLNGEGWWPFGALVRVAAAGAETEKTTARSGKDGANAGNGGFRNDKEGNDGVAGALIPDDPALNYALRRQMKKAPAPKLPLTVRLKNSVWRYGPRFSAGYRLNKFACSVGDCWYHQFSIMAYPLAMASLTNPWWRLLRFGLGIEAGGETTQKRERWWQRNQSMYGVISLGMQYPHRVTPFLDFVLTLGAIHRHIYNKDLFHFAHSVGIETGAAVFIWKHFQLGASVGWRRSVIKVDPKSLYYDSFTMNVWLGV
jgi:hypothetical protein